ncbi:hypothetical protein A2482_01480 [Candidatus Falkowbacteria bacterium RIFOXYC2_FULL_48_21]|uniref:Type II secretion system protein GspG C-terminal domain-containing protein n=1 Tax=Candidatus Falkowbacteria bacterium RIFOXYC2_FULL_48_21 TaxID=1798005 RepID=A0A1F5T6Z0_9BACT|nr:MAG: hypothetical protein A2482_01480 [Candidatus Falkowbacteria bacterium RIFOXYC2_FULL_48_21]
MRTKGFTLVEILIALGVFGLLLAGLAGLLNANQKELRDGKRIGDMQALRSAMSVVKNQKGGFDQAYCEIGPVSACAKKASSVLVDVFPGLAKLNDPESPAASCADAAACQSGACNYAFVKIEPNDYEARFAIERGIDGYPAAGCYKVTPEGIIKL